MIKKPFVAIILLNYNGKSIFYKNENESILDRCINSLKITDYPKNRYKVIMADNGSTDGSDEYVKKKYKFVEVVHFYPNRGFSGGMNYGIRYAMKKYKPDYFLLLSNDTEIIQKDWLTKLVESAESDEKVGVVGCLLLYPDKTIQHAGVNFKLNHIGYGKRWYRLGFYNKINNAFAVTFTCVLIKKDIIEKVRFLDEIFSPGLFEDMDFCFRVRRSGYIILFNGEVKAIHKESVTISKPPQKETYYISQRNSLIVFLRYYPTSFKIKEIIKSLFFRPFVSKNKIYNTIIFHNDFIDKFILSLKALKESVLKYKTYNTR
jgi:GT2 family glycosyltransferase